jgi:hypothetical protein
VILRNLAIVETLPYAVPAKALAASPQLRKENAAHQAALFELLNF